MKNYSIFLPSYSIGKDEVYHKVAEICTPYGKKAVVIGGKKAMAAVDKKLSLALSGSDIFLSGFVWYGGEASYENVDMLKENELVKEADMIFAVGGGKAIDTSKTLGEKTGKPVFTFPTIASNCASVTSVSIMYSKEGVFKEPFFFKKPPVHSFINTSVMAEAPYKYFWAGMGDTYAKYFEAEVSSRNEDTLIHYHRLGVVLSQMCLEPILKYGKKALDDNKKGESSYFFEQAVLAVTVTTGIASILLTSEHIIDYNTGFGHAVFYALTSYPHIEKNHLHGEVVAFGILLLLLLDGQKDMFVKMFDFNKSVGLPTSLQDIEMKEENLSDLIPKITKMHDIDHNPYLITEEMVKNAFNSLKEYNENYKV